jgi:hypothetical protein
MENTRKITCTGIRVAARRGGAPSFGDATFSDGRSYRFLLLPEGHFSFSGTRRRHQVYEDFSFSSPGRDAALREYLA